MREEEATADLLDRIKRIYRASGIRYHDVAEALGVSEATVKRLMNGRGLTVAMLNRLCAIGQITLFELVELVQREQLPETPVVNLEQASALAGNLRLGTIFFLLDRGWDAARIAEEFDLDEIMMTRYLTRLDTIGVIALFPGNRIRLLRRMSRNLRYRLSGSNMISARVTGFLDNFDASDPNTVWSSGIARLSPASHAKVAELLDDLRDAVFALGEQDLVLPRDQVHWHVLFAGVSPINTESLLGEEPRPAKG